MLDGPFYCQAFVGRLLQPLDFTTDTVQICFEADRKKFFSSCIIQTTEK
jgi:hypothetical protein